MRLSQVTVLPLLALAAVLTTPAVALERLELEIDEIITPQAHVAGAAVSVDLTPRNGPQVQIRATDVTLDEPVGTLRDVEIHCPDIIVREPRFGCRSGQIRANGSPLGSLAFTAVVEFNSRQGRLAITGDGQPIAGSQARFEVMADSAGWTLNAQANTLELTGLRQLAARWVSIPADYSIDGRVDAQLVATGRDQGTQIDVQLSSSDLSFTNETSTVVGEKLAFTANAVTTLAGDRTWLDVQFRGSSGQALAGPVLLDFGQHPLELQARASLADQAVTLDSLSVRQARLLQATGTGRIALQPKLSLQRADLLLESVEFPGAYTSFLQIPLATTDFGALQTWGKVRGMVRIENDAPAAIRLLFDDVSIEDERDKFSMASVNGVVHWVRDTTAPVEPSYLAWDRGSAYGLSGGAARVDFITRGMGFELTRPARLPVFDGAINVRTLAARQLGQDDAELDFDATIEPISMPLLSRAFGWPELQGSLAGQIPGLTYRNRDLVVQGDLVANVFDGTIVGRNFRLRDPLGPWPRLFADVTARRLDLELVTRTFAIGTITGRLDADIENLELFNWSPVAFNARLYSTPGDRSRKVISQKAVTSISNVGGGGGVVTAALQSGVLRFFDDFRYDRLGITCELRAEVCLMSGIEPAKEGYYIVKGSRLPRIDIIGNQGRVDWPTLVSQIVAGMRSENVIID